MDVIYDWPIGTLVCGILLLSIVATEIGFRYGRRARKQQSDRDFAMTTGIKASIIGLVALLLGFSFSITSSRYSERVRLIINEANAIGTCFDRAGLLADPAKNQIRTALRRYTALRLVHYNNRPTSAEFVRTGKEMDAALRELWAGAAQAVSVDAQLANTSQIVAGANEVMDLSTVREWAMLNRLPPAVIILLGLCVVISGGMVGHSSAEAGERHPGLWIALNILIMMVVFVILDFDRPRRGLIRISQSPLVKVQEEIGGR